VTGVTALQKQWENIGVTALQKQLEKHLEIRTKATTTTKEELHKLLLLLQKRNRISRKIHPVHPAYNPYFSACFFSRNSIFLSHQISQRCFSAGLSQTHTYISCHLILG
jgi:hypothetical protein